MESERRLKASGKYKNDLTIKLVRSKNFPHFTIEVELQEVDRWYFGADGSYAQGPAFLGEAEDRSYRYQRQSLAAQLYYGTRDYNDRGLALDFELIANSSGISGKGNAQAFTSNYKYRNLFNGLTASILQKHFLSDYTYAYTGILSRTIASRSWISSEGSFEYESDNQRKKTISSAAAEDYSVYGSIEPVLGIRIGKLLLGGKISRSLTRNLKQRENDTETSYINDIEQPSSTQRGDYSTPNMTFDNTAEFSLMWSDKSQLTVIEPGLDLHATWSRRYDDRATDPPKWLVHAEYTLLLSDQLASTILSDGEWEYRQADERQTKLKRIIDIGLRFDYVTVQQVIAFGEFYRVGAKRSEIRGSYESGQPVLDNRVNVGIKYASPSLIYSLSLCYGSPLAGEYFLGSTVDTVYKRIGIR